MKNVIDLNPKKKEEQPVFKIIDKQSERCDHRKTIIDVKNRTVHCQLCDAIIDPFDVLLQLSDKESNMFKTLDNLVNKINETRKTYRSLWEVLKKRSRYKCKHCNKFNEAHPQHNWSGEVIAADFKRSEE